MREKLRSEFLRKTIHLAGISVPISYYFFGREIALLLSSSALILFLVLEYIRVRAHSIFPLSRTVEAIQRRKEIVAIAANVYYCVAAVISIYFFGELPAIAGLTIALISDAAAALVGVSLGRHRLKSGKSVEGTLGGAVSALVISLLIGLNMLTALALSAIFCLVDIKDLGLDDNFIMPVLMVIAVELAGML